MYNGLDKLISAKDLIRWIQIWSMFRANLPNHMLYHSEMLHYSNFLALYISKYINKHIQEQIIGNLYVKFRMFRFNYDWRSVFETCFIGCFNLWMNLNDIISKICIHIIFLTSLQAMSFLFDVLIYSYKKIFLKVFSYLVFANTKLPADFINQTEVAIEWSFWKTLNSKCIEKICIT